MNRMSIAVSEVNLVNAVNTVNAAVMRRGKGFFYQPLMNTDKRSCRTQ
jgi:hypothetical protein